MKKWLKTLLSGMAIGFGSAVPGVSGGTIAVIFKVYDKIIWAVSNIFKHFKEAFRVLLPTLLGVVIALIPTIYLMDKALNGFVFGVICIFGSYQVVKLFTGWDHQVCELVDAIGDVPGVCSCNGNMSVDELLGRTINRIDSIDNIQWHH